MEAIKNILAFGKARQYEQGLLPMTKKTFYERNALSRKTIEEDDPKKKPKPNLPESMANKETTVK